MRGAGLALALVSLFVTQIVRAPAVVGAQPMGDPPRIGYLNPGLADAPMLRHTLREIGLVDGQNVAIEPRGAEGDLSRLPHLAADLVRTKVDVIVAVGNEAIRAARDATATIPIVMRFSTDDPVTAGFVGSYARPGGNVTGMTILSPSLAAKRLELLKEVVPRLDRVAILVNPKRASYQLRHTEAAARSLGLRIQVVNTQASDAYALAFAAMTREKAQALYVTPDQVFFTDQKLLVDLAARNRLPVLYESREFVDAGGLMAYGPNYLDLTRRVAHYVDRILKGARPRDLPVEEPSRFELAVNLRTAKALGLTIPPSVRLRADQVIE